MRELIAQINLELELEQFEERAAIIQEGTGCSRAEAERAARTLTAGPPGRQSPARTVRTGLLSFPP
jgi:hypothetical protein